MCCLLLHRSQSPPFLAYLIRLLLLSLPKVLSLSLNLGGFQRSSLSLSQWGGFNIAFFSPVIVIGFSGSGLWAWGWNGILVFFFYKFSGDGEFQTKRDRISEEEEREMEFHVCVCVCEIERERLINKWIEHEIRTYDVECTVKCYIKVAKVSFGVLK